MGSPKSKELKKKNSLPKYLATIEELHYLFQESSPVLFLKDFEFHLNLLPPPHGPFNNRFLLGAFVTQHKLVYKKTALEFKKTNFTNTVS